MFQWKYVVFSICFIALSLFGIPVKFDPPVDPNETAFRQFLTKYNKSYTTKDEYKRRFHTFKESMSIIETLNQQRVHPDSALFGVTEYCDMTLDEFQDNYLSVNLVLSPKTDGSKSKGKSHHHHHHHTINHIRKRRNPVGSNLPDTIDWRTKGAVTAVNDQKLCGACWAFSVIETVESMSAIQHGNLEELSVQQAIDCAGYGNMGCDGGDTCTLVQWLVQNKIKIERAAVYPLILETGTCKLKRTLEGVQVAANYTCSSLIGKEEKMLEMLANNGPIAVAVNALPWQFYLGGIIQFNCDHHLESINHAVQLVGYDLSASIPYYIVRNSWGTRWGNKGYAKLSIGNNICGVATRVTGLNVV